MRKYHILISLFAFVIIAMFSFTSYTKSDYINLEKDKYAVFDKENNLLRPKNYREWIFVGSEATPKRINSDAIFGDHQNIYIDPKGFKYWKENGKFMEGTVFVKELLYETDSISPVGHGSYQGRYFSLSAMVKDSKRFPNALDGWEYFKFTDLQNKILTEKSKPLSKECAGCHNPNAIDKSIFYQYYPVLLDSKGYGKDNPENANIRNGLTYGRKYQLPKSHK